ncbi:MAG: DUF2442 domain-containing protein [Oligoflexia bacterium]|nr:DUF2442 domain-containing protein [Oligoflexia bacterium]
MYHSVMVVTEQSISVHLMSNPPTVFVPLKDKEEFKKVSVNPVGRIEWACGADLSAEYLLSS